MMFRFYVDLDGYFKAPFRSSGLVRADAIVSRTIEPKVVGLSLAACTDCGAVLLGSFASDHVCAAGTPT